MPKIKTPNLHLHLEDLKLKKFPRKNKVKESRAAILRLTNDLVYNNALVQHAAQICRFEIKSVPSKSRFSLPPSELFREVRTFIYHYENFLHRMYAYREKMVQFLNAALDIGYSEKEVNIEDLKKLRKIKLSGFLGILKRFSENTHLLGQIIAERNVMTHRLPGTENVDHLLRPVPKASNSKTFRVWCRVWEKGIKERAKKIDRTFMLITGINSEVASRLAKYLFTSKRYI